MVKSKNRNKHLVLIAIIVLIIASLFLYYRFLFLEPCGKPLRDDEILYNVSEYPFHEIDLSPWVLHGSENSEIFVEVSCIGEMNRYWFVKKFDFTKFRYIWTSEDLYRGVKIKYDFSTHPYDESNNVLLLIPLPKDGKECRVFSFYYGICG